VSLASTTNELRHSITSSDQLRPLRQSLKGVPRLLEETPTGRLSVAQVFPPRRALARGRGAIVFVVVALAAFSALYLFVKRDRTHAFDLRVTLGIQRLRLPGFNRLMRLVSWPGFPPQSRYIPPALSLIWLALGFPIEALFQLLAWGTGAISGIVKRAMGRPRPSPDAVLVMPGRIGGSSFPSGHVLIYSGVYGFLAFLLETLIRPRWLRRLAVSLLVSFVSLVGPSRIYLGHHWLTDVTASYLLGTSYLLALMALYRRVKTRWLSSRR
jgi:membrane-associated phospholipid phosphatase